MELAEGPTADISLPEGYEVRVDPVSKKPFFINHHTKGTSWIDPRDRYESFLIYFRVQKRFVLSFPYSETNFIRLLQANVEIFLALIYTPMGCSPVGVSQL